MPSNDSYKTVFNDIREAVFIHDANTGAILEANEAMSAMYGYHRDDITDCTIDDLSSGQPPYDQAHALNHIQAALSTGAENFEWHAKKKDGSLFWVEVSLSRTLMNGQTRIIAVVRDITDRKLGEQVHKETQRLLNFTQFTVNQAKIAVFWCHHTGFFFYVNDTACEWLQYSREELMSMHVADINPEFPREGWPDHWQAIKDHGLVQMESVHRRKNGEVYPVKIFSNYVLFEGQEYKLAFVHDITAQKEAESEKAILEERLRHTQRIEALGTMAGGIAHDLNNMLSPILGYAELLIHDLSEKSVHQKKLKRIYKAGERARDLTRQLLLFGRKQPLEITPLNLNQIITGLDPILRRTIRENIRIESKKVASLPAIEGDAGQIEQVLLNLAINAKDAMPDGGKITIKTKTSHLDEGFPEFQSTDKPGPYVLLSVSDTGKGISKEVMPRIFEPFFTTKEVGKGTGLGLSTAYGIVKQHKGYLWAYSEPGHGTTFKAYFPVSDSKPTDRGEQGDILFHEGSETILIAEDQSQVLQLAADILTSAGYHVLEAEDGHSALDAGSEYSGPIHLLLTDVVMPDMNGKQLYQRMVARNPGLKVLYMSGYTDNVIVHHGIVDRGIHFISKPFGVQDLLLKVRETLDSED